MRGQYIAAVGFDGQPMTQKQFDKWKKPFDRDSITEIGSVDGLPWYIITIKPDPILMETFMRYSK